MTLKLCSLWMVLFLVAGLCLAADKPVSDDTIYDSVRMKLASDIDVKGGALKVDVKQGVVTLEGVLDSQRLKDRATGLAKKCKGVKRVENNIQVKNHS